MKICTIYSIKNTKNGKRYVGSSINFLNRTRAHLQLLKDNKHINSKLQRSYNKYGKENFIIEILEEFENTTKEFQFEREQYYMDFYESYKNGFNCTSNAAFNGSLNNWTIERRKSVGDHFSKILKGKIPKNYHEMCKIRWKPIEELENGVIVNTYPSCKKAGEFLGINYKTLHIALKKGINKIGKFPNKTWRYVDEKIGQKDICL